MRRNFTINRENTQQSMDHDLELGTPLRPIRSKFSFNHIIDSPQRRIPRRMSFKAAGSVRPKSPPLHSLGNHDQNPTATITDESSGNNRSDSSNSSDSHEGNIGHINIATEVGQNSPEQEQEHPHQSILGHAPDNVNPKDAVSVKPINERDIRFGDLPAPRKAKPRQVSVQPHEMAMSIGMMDQFRSNSYSEGPALVIKGPLETSSDEDEDEDGAAEKHTTSRPIQESLHRTKTSIPTEKPHDRPGMNNRSFTMDRIHHIGKSFHNNKTFGKILTYTRHPTQTSDQGDRSSLHRIMSSNYVSWEPTIGGNSVFVGLTDEQREELGGVEYRALKLLSKILVAYYVGFHVLGSICLIPWAVRTSAYQHVFKSNAVTPVWWAIFTATSSFNDLGLTLTSDSMMSFVQARYPILVSSFLIVAGNTGFPCLLRLIIWTAFKCSPVAGRTRESLGFLLDHPRRCFTLLFPSHATWWLFAVLVIFNVVDLILFIILDLNSVSIDALPVSIRILAGLYQAFSTRTAGFSVVDLSTLHVAVQVSYMVMMYVSVLPLAMSIRRTNVYEEQSLGVYLEHENEDEAPTMIGTHIRKQLSFDLWFIFLGLFIITIAEGHRLGPGDEAFSTFAVLFEVVSAYGTVGLSLGYPGTPTSFCGQFKTISKLVIVALLYRGKHRGLPYRVDRAIILPSDKLDKTDDAQEKRLQRARELTGDFSGDRRLSDFTFNSGSNFGHHETRATRRMSHVGGVPPKPNHD